LISVIGSRSVMTKTILSSKRMVRGMLQPLSITDKGRLYPDASSQNPLDGAGPADSLHFVQLLEPVQVAVRNYTGYSDFAHPDPEVRKRELAALLKNLDIARELGAPSVRALTGQQWPGVDQEDGIQWIIEGIRRVAEEADRVGLRLNVENHT
jgi:sugar phosphate isomerase/epimerase